MHSLLAAFLFLLSFPSSASCMMILSSQEFHFPFQNYKNVIYESRLENDTMGKVDFVSK